jgi:ABC-type oligopeptide transport system substrate-binding subunit
MRQAKQYQIVGDQPVSQLGEPNDLMPLFLTGSPVNYYGYKNAEADKLWQEQSTTLDVTKRRQLTAQIEKILLTDAMVAPQGFLRTTTVLQPYVKGFVAFDAAYCANMSWEVVWLDK